MVLVKPKVRHVIEEWQKRGIYTFKQIEDVGGREYLSQQVRFVIVKLTECVGRSDFFDAFLG